MSAATCFNKDLIVGHPDADGARGEVRIVFGWVADRSDFSLDQAQVVITGANAGDRFGFRTNAGFITTRDVQPEVSARDLIVGAPGAAGGRGEVYLFAGPFETGAVLSTSNAVFRITGAAGDQLGTVVESADVNRDGYREIIIGAPGNGRVYVVDYHNAGSSTRDLSIQPAEQTITGAGIGHVLAAGDLTADSAFELIDRRANGEQRRRRRWHILQGRTTGPVPPTVSLPAGASATFPGSIPGDNAGGRALWVKESGDFDGDRLLDLLIAAHDADGPRQLASWCR